VRFRSAIAATLLLPLTSAAPNPVRLQPSSPWNLDYAENSCRLIRVFGEGKSKTILQIEGSAPRDFDMVAIGRPVQSYAERVKARFIPAGVKTFDGKVFEAAKTRHPAILWTKVRLLPDSLFDAIEEQWKTWDLGVRPPAENLDQQAAMKAERLAFAEAATALEILSRSSRPVILETGSMGKPIRMFDACLRDSLKDWGVDPALDEKIVRKVWLADRSLSFRSRDYPPRMLHEGKQGDVDIRVLVDATGRVTKCTATSQFVETGFNAATCEVVTRRMKFEPAELADGTKVPSYYVRRIAFRIYQ
jgi:TonB family protein